MLENFGAQRSSSEVRNTSLLIGRRSDSPEPKFWETFSVNTATGIIFLLSTFLFTSSHHGFANIKCWIATSCAPCYLPFNFCSSSSLCSIEDRFSRVDALHVQKLPAVVSDFHNKAPNFSRNFRIRLLLSTASPLRKHSPCSHQLSRRAVASLGRVQLGNRLAEACLELLLLRRTSRPAVGFLVHLGKTLNRISRRVLDYLGA